MTHATTTRPEALRRPLRTCIALIAGFVAGFVTFSSARAATLQQECDAAELHAMSKRLRAEAMCSAKFARDPGADVLGCRDGARDRFEERMDDALETAEEEGIQ